MTPWWMGALCEKAIGMLKKKKGQGGATFPGYLGTLGTLALLGVALNLPQQLRHGGLEVLCVGKVLVEEAGADDAQPFTGEGEGAVSGGGEAPLFRGSGPSPQAHLWL